MTHFELTHLVVCVFGHEAVFEVHLILDGLFLVTENSLLLNKEQGQKVVDVEAFVDDKYQVDDCHEEPDSNEKPPIIIDDVCWDHGIQECLLKRTKNKDAELVEYFHVVVHVIFEWLKMHHIIHVHQGRDQM